MFRPTNFLLICFLSITLMGAESTFPENSYAILKDMLEDNPDIVSLELLQKQTISQMKKSLILIALENHDGDALQKLIKLGVPAHAYELQQSISIALKTQNLGFFMAFLESYSDIKVHLCIDELINQFHCNTSICLELLQLIRLANIQVYLFTPALIEASNLIRNHRDGIKLAYTLTKCKIHVGNFEESLDHFAREKNSFLYDLLMHIEYICNCIEILTSIDDCEGIELQIGYLRQLNSFVESLRCIFPQNEIDTLFAQAQLANQDGMLRLLKIKNEDT